MSKDFMEILVATITALEEEFHFLEQNRLQDFYDELVKRAKFGHANSLMMVNERDIGSFTEFFLKNGVDIFQYINKLYSFMFEETEFPNPTVILPPTIEEIPRFLMRDSNIQSLYIPDSVHTIERFALVGCPGLQEIIIAGKPKIGRSSKGATFEKIIGKSGSENGLTVRCADEEVFKIISENAQFCKYGYGKYTQVVLGK